MPRVTAAAGCRGAPSTLDGGAAGAGGQGSVKLGNQISQTGKTGAVTAGFTISSNLHSRKQSHSIERGQNHPQLAPFDRGYDVTCGSPSTAP